MTELCDAANSARSDEIDEALELLRAVFPPRAVFDDLVRNGAHGHEEHTIRGDELASACWALDILIEHFKRTPDGTIDDLPTLR